VKYVSSIIHNFFGDKRSSKATKNTIYSFLIKGYAMLIQFALVPITLNYLDKFHYGIWLVIASILEWFAYFDIGIGNGLRNKLSEALALDDLKLAKVYTSTSYALVTMIFTGFIILFTIANPFLNWGTILNVPPVQVAEVSEVIFFVVIFFCLRFILGIITSVIFANQDPAIRNFIGPLGSTLALVSIILLSNYVSGSLFWIAIIFSGAPLLVLLILTLWLFSTRYKRIRPGISHVDFSYSRKILGLGSSFFIIQVSMLVLYSSANMILTQLYGPEEVTVYNIAHKYFTVGTLLTGIITLPYWSSITEAYHKKDFDWIRESIKKLSHISFILAGGQIVLLLLADFIVYWWVGDMITIPLSLKISLTLYVIIQLIATPYVIFINGVSKIRLQLYVAVLSIVIAIPLAIFFSKTLGFGPSGVVLALISFSLPSGFLWKTQYHKIINGKARGVWNA
jgi:O-antigen/teichoic acid export membrane protein